VFIDTLDQAAINILIAKDQHANQSSGNAQLTID